MAITSLFLSLRLRLPNLLPAAHSRVLNYLLTPANLLAAELWSALNELLREHHKLEYSALSQPHNVGQPPQFLVDPTIKLFKRNETWTNWKCLYRENFMAECAAVFMRGRRLSR